MAKGPRFNRDCRRFPGVQSGPTISMNPTKTKPSPAARAFVKFYGFIHGRLHLRGSGLMLRAAARFLPGLRAFPLAMKEVGTVSVDFREEASYGLLNYTLGERGSDWSLLAALGAVLKPGDVLWDIGANVGCLAQHFARPRFQLAGIHAFEPNVCLRPALESLFAQQPRVQVHFVGLGERDENRAISVVPHASLDSSLVRDLPGALPLPISIRRGDDYRRATGIPPPSVIKMDVEGFEPEVFRGLPETISEAQPFIFFEHIWLTDETVRACVPPGYALTFLLDDGRLTNDFAQRWAGANAILVPAQKAHLLPAQVKRADVP
jgi:FkbM family methyltransferase